MGKRNLALVGTHEDFFADIFDEKTGTDPSFVAHCASPQDAAASYFNNIFQNSHGLVRNAVVAVWPVAAGRRKLTIFDACAVVTRCKEPDAEPDEYDIFLDVRERL